MNALGSLNLSILSWLSDGKKSSLLSASSLTALRSLNILGFNSGVSAKQNIGLTGRMVQHVDIVPNSIYHLISDQEH